MQKQKISWLQWSLLIAAVSVACIAIGLLQCAWIRKKMLKHSGIIEIDLEKDNTHDQ